MRGVVKEFEEGGDLTDIVCPCHSLPFPSLSPPSPLPLHQGYVPREPLPPLDPYVERDREHLLVGAVSQSDSAIYQRPSATPIHLHTSSPSPSPAQMDLQRAPMVAAPRGVLARSAPSTGSHSPPSPRHNHHSATPPLVNNAPSAFVPVANGHIAVVDTHAPVANGYTVTADGPAPIANGYIPLVNGHPSVSNGVALPSPQPQPPPLKTVGRYGCPRCGRRFGSDSDCKGHKLRCMS